MRRVKVEFLAIAALFVLSNTCTHVCAAESENAAVAIYLHKFLHNAEPYDFEYAPYINGANMTQDFFNLLKNGNSLGFEFYNEWQSIVRSVDRQTQQLQCFQQLSQLVAGFAVNDLTSYKYFDSWGKIPAGILKGHITEFGNFDECIDIKKSLTADNHITGKYCFANVPVGQLLAGNPLLAAFPVRIGICMPAVCSATEFDIFLKIFLKALLNLSIPNGQHIVNENSCKLREKEGFTADSWAAVAVLSILVAAMAFSSLYEFLFKAWGKKPNDFLCSFSVQRNMSQLVRITPNVKSPYVIPCLNGIRCLSIVWVLIGHSATLTFILPHINTLDIFKWGRTPFSMFIQKGNYSVDTFFFLSGLLVAFIGLRDIENNNGKIKVPMMYIHRILRLTPMLALAILVYTGLQTHLTNSPIWGQFSQYTMYCPKNWWLTLLYVQNYVNLESMCINHAWYLAVDMQLYIISPLLLFLLVKWGKKGAAVIAAIGIALAAWLFTKIVVNGYVFHTAGFAIPGPDAGTKTYFPTHLRASAWIVGLLLGYFMHLNRHKRVIIPKGTVAFGWLLCFAILMTIIFAVYPQAQANARPMTSVEEAFYWSFGRIAWPLALSWIVLTGFNGYGGPVNAFLACPLWQPLARLSYCMYIWHMFVENFNAGRNKTNTYFSSYDMLLRFWSDYGWTIILSAVMYLAFEAPLVNIERMLLPKKKAKRTSNESPLEKDFNKAFQQIETAKFDDELGVAKEVFSAEEPKLASSHESINVLGGTAEVVTPVPEVTQIDAGKDIERSSAVPVIRNAHSLAIEQLDEILENADSDEMTDTASDTDKGTVL